jgi:predicted amidophosphoribosyltransferase
MTEEPGFKKCLKHLQSESSFCADCGTQLKNTDESCPCCGLWLECHENTVIHDPEEAERRKEKYKNRFNT